MIKSLKKFVANESGATAIEYALIASLSPLLSSALSLR
jgi:Flp pilus assembly pilin Flp